jgi:hypothetical protein
MELYKRIIEIIDANLIYCLIPIILTLIVVELIFKNRFSTQKTLNLIRWTILIYTIVSLVFFLIELATNPSGNPEIHRTTGNYGAAHWVMLLGALVLPLTLFSRKLASNFWYVLLIAFGMKSGTYFERFVLITTHIHRDYLTENGNPGLESMATGIGVFFIQGILIALLALGIFELAKETKQVCTNIE